ncbi:quinolinate phosphoribosyl transferase [Fusibacter paucivorans]|uniref:Quinolinate phosphoribosyl transferase n=1 Tax=Fusibacter paucivorans TaxID=76009 RepID=A0ABS5PP73_9FIRM|nr:quinolinate phosphoribosyl transferase [Fusibacter paucivorans]MBS7526189.1 quinolinate phosphoribosyl transferase [Fusibacter paucivorans]
MIDIRKEILKGIRNKQFEARITVDREGVVVGTLEAAKQLKHLALDYEFCVHDGDAVDSGDTICTLKGFSENLIMAEETVIGRMAKASGVATAAFKAVKLADDKGRIVAGAWKKMPNEMKRSIQQTVGIVGASTRMIEMPFVYLDKNYIQMLGGISEALYAVKAMEGLKKVVQLKGKYMSIDAEARTAVEAGADILMVDTGRLDDLKIVKQYLETLPNTTVQVGFASDLKIAEIPTYLECGADFLCFGKEIIDAPLLDMKLDVISEVSNAV